MSNSCLWIGPPEGPDDGRYADVCDDLPHTYRNELEALHAAIGVFAGRVEAMLDDLENDMIIDVQRASGDSGKSADDCRAEFKDFCEAKENIEGGLSEGLRYLEKFAPRLRQGCGRPLGGPTPSTSAGAYNATTPADPYVPAPPFKGDTP